MSEPATENTGESRGGTANLKPWVKGQSGNPGGRPKGLARAVREIPGELGLGEGELILARFWWGIIGNEKWDQSQRLQASKLLAERGWGKPVEFVPIENDDPLEIEIYRAPDEERVRELAHIVVDLEPRRIAKAEQNGQ